jgi:predicted Zn-dependent protease
MDQLTFADKQYLRAAEGWIELGNHLEANNELENIGPSSRSHPDVLEIRFAIFSKECKWDACLDIVQALTQLAPDRVWGWLHLAYATRRAANGSVQAAWDILISAVKQFPREPIVAYNLACYACQLGRLKDAEEWLHRSYELGNANQIKLMALNDDDLQPLFRPKEV